MATLTELNAVLGDSDLRIKLKIAILIAAEKVVVELNTTPNHTERTIWAFSAMQKPENYVSTLINKLMAENEGLSVAAILSSSDAAIQTAVDGAVNFLSGVVS